MNSWFKAENSTTVNTVNLSHNTGCTSSKKKKDMHIKGWQKSLSRLTLTLIATDSWQIWTLVCKESLQNLNFRLDIFSGRIPYLWQVPCINLCQIPLKTKFGRFLSALAGSSVIWSLLKTKYRCKILTLCCLSRMTADQKLKGILISKITDLRGNSHL